MEPKPPLETLAIAPARPPLTLDPLLTWPMKSTCALFGRHRRDCEPDPRPLLKIILGPHKVAGRQQSGAKQNERKLTRHAGHGMQPLADKPFADLSGLRVYSYGPSPIFTTLVGFVREKKPSGYPHGNERSFATPQPYCLHTKRAEKPDAGSHKSAICDSAARLAIPSRHTSFPGRLRAPRGPIHGRVPIPSFRRTGTAA